MPVLALLAILLLALFYLTGEEEGESWKKVVQQEEFIGLPKGKEGQEGGHSFAASSHLRSALEISVVEK